jgi:capsular polysaccharide biosynthesis protein
MDGSYLWITDRMSHNYHHWVCDCLPRLEAWLAANPGADLLLPRRVLAQSFVSESLAAYPQVRVVPQPAGSSALVENLVLPDRTSPEGFQHPLLTARVGERLRNHFAAGIEPSGRRIYASRERARFRRAANEAALLSILVRHGYESVLFEQLSFGGQVTLMAGVERLCGPHGAGLTNMLFMAPGAVVELRQLAGTPNCFFTLANVCSHAYWPVGCNAVEEGLPVHTADLSVDPQALEQALSQA